MSGVAGLPDTFGKNCRWHCVHDHRQCVPDSKVHGANMGPIRGRQDPGGPDVDLLHFAIWGVQVVEIFQSIISLKLNIKGESTEQRICLQNTAAVIFSRKVNKRKTYAFYWYWKRRLKYGFNQKNQLLKPWIWCFCTIMNMRFGNSTKRSQFIRCIFTFLNCISIINSIYFSHFK